MNDSTVRTIVCSGILMEAFDVLATKAREQHDELRDESSGGPAYHLTLAQRLHEEVKAFARAKRAFLTKEAHKSDPRALLDELWNLLDALKTTIIEPLEELVDNTPESQRRFGFIRKTRLYVPIAEHAQTLLEESRILHSNAVRLYLEQHTVAPLPSTAHVFVASSTEGLPRAYELKGLLEDDTIKVNVWNERHVVKLTLATLEALERLLSEYHVGIFLFTPDDLSLIRDDLEFTARANVVLELGLFIGRHGRSRSFIVHPKEGMGKISDLHGVTTADYDSTAPLLDQAIPEMKSGMASAVEKIRAAIEAQRPPPAR